MKRAYPLFLLCFLLLAAAMPALAQHHGPGSARTPDSDRGWRIGAVVGYVVVPEKTRNGREHLILPSFGLDLEYWFSSRFGLGLHNDLELMVFEVETEADRFIEREFPLLITLDALWKPWKGLVLFGGPGIELEPSEHFFVGRVGMEYEIAIGHHWDLYPSLFYDFRQGAYDTFSFGLGVAKRF